jgi:hypothetical protein
MSWVERICFVAWLVIGMAAFQTMFDLYDPKHCILVCPK